MSKMRSSMIRQAGFTLLEIAIVMVVVAMLAGGVVAGREVLKSAKLKSVTDDIGTITRAAQEFQKIHGGLPGDLYDARNKLGSAAAIRGNGNGVLEPINNFGDNEIRGFWQHLALSGLLPGNFDGASDAPGVGTKAGKLPQSGYYVSTNAANELEISFSRFNGGPGRAVLTPEQAWELDKKYDDGNPATGFIQATNGTDTAATSCVNAGAYVMGNDTITCIIQTRAQNTGRSVANAAEAAVTTAVVACPGGNAGAASTPVGGTRDCTCAADMVGTCVERCLAGGIWQYESGCNYPDCDAVNGVRAGAGTADFASAAVGAPPTTGTCTGGWVGYDDTGAKNPAFPKLRCLPPGGPTGYHVKTGGLPGADNPIVGDCRPNDCSNAPVECGAPSSGIMCTFPTSTANTLNVAPTGGCPAGHTGAPLLDCSPTAVWTNLHGSLCTPNPCAAASLGCGSAQNCSFPATASGATASATCPAGYTGSPTSLCTTGAWGAVGGTLCTPAPCTAQTLACGSGQNCSFAATASGSTATATCPAGYSGTPQRACSLGTWGALGGTACAPDPCAAASLSCGSGQNCTFAATPSGSTATGTCPVGYTGTPQSLCTAGTWGAVGGTLCSATPSCGAPPSFPNVILTGSGNYVGDTRIARCDATGWYFGMPQQLDCANPGPAWTGTGPTCVTLNCAVNNCTPAGGNPVECTDPAVCPNNNPCGPAPAGPFGSAPSGSGFGYSALRSYTCDSCFGAAAAGTEVARYICDNTSNWKGYESGACTAGVDPRPAVSNGRLVNLRKSGPQWISDVQCDSGYSLLGNANGDATTTCTSGTTVWTGAGNCVKPIVISSGALFYSTWTTGGTPMRVDDGIQLLASGNMSSATVQITSGLDTANDFLEFTNQLGITGSYNAGTGTLTLTGTTTVANYQTALRAVTFRNRLMALGCGSRTITVTAALPDFGTPPSASRVVTLQAQTFAPPAGNLRLWYRADNATPAVHNSRVTSLPDFSGNANNASNSGGYPGPRYLTNQINGRPTLHFDSTATCGNNNPRYTLKSSANVGISGNTNITHIAVLKGGHSSYGAMAFGNGATVGNMWIVVHSSSGEARIGGALHNGPLYDNNRTGYRVNVWQKTPGSLATTFSNWENGVASTAVSGGAAHTPNYLNTRFLLGDIFYDSSDDCYAWKNGYFAETLLYNRVLTVAERELIENYIAGKWWDPEMASTLTRASNTSGSCAGMCADATMAVGGGPDQLFVSALNGQTRQVNCAPGYIGTPQSTCTAGTWGPVTGSCTPCPSATSPVTTINATNAAQTLVGGGFTATAGCPVRIISSGKWRVCTGTGNINTMQVGVEDPGRIAMTGYAANCPVGHGASGWGALTVPYTSDYNTCRVGSLVVRIGATGPWECVVGDDYTIVPQASGDVYLKMNDYTGWFGDNMGQLKATLYK